jgi:tryptophan synthase alpha chain
MNRLKQIFANKQSKVLNVYFTAGFPDLNDTIPIMKSLAKNGADIIEIGMPYSDPLADGPTIQESGSKALSNGMNMKLLFQQLANCRNNPILKDTGIILMGYMNPVLQYGFEDFCKDAASVGVDGLILPDLPEFEFENEFQAIIHKYGLDFIFLVTPETSPERVMHLDRLSSGFLYAVSASATTGGATDFDLVERYLQRLQLMQLNNPILVGFGIKDKTSFDAACKHANGAIIGSAYIAELGKMNDIEETTQAFLQSIIRK